MIRNVNFWIFLIGMGLGLLIGIPSQLHAKNEIELYYATYSDDENLTASAPMLRGSLDISESSTINLYRIWETFEKSITGDSSNSNDAISGATTVIGGTGSGFSEDRTQTGVSIDFRLGNNYFLGSYDTSDEPDYDSDSMRAQYARDFFNKNLSVAFEYRTTDDKIDKLDPPRVGFPKSKTVDTYTLAATQLVSPTFFLTGGASIEDHSGYLSNPTRRISITTIGTGGNSTTIYLERHPSDRLRQVYFFRGKKYFNTRSALDINFSYYTDDWDVTSKSIEFRASNYFSNQYIGRIRFRKYTQSAAEFYKTEYSSVESIMTADVRLQEFDSTTIGFKLTYLPRVKDFNDMSVWASLDHYHETNYGIEALIFGLGTIIPF